MVTLQRWPGYKFIKCKFTLCPSLWAKNMGFISGTNLRELILFCCSLTCPKLCVAIVWAIFLSFPALIPHGWCPYHLTSAQDLRVWILFSLFFIFFFHFQKSVFLHLNAAQHCNECPQQRFGCGGLQQWPLRRGWVLLGTAGSSQLQWSHCRARLGPQLQV